ncbi:MAG: MFS transporter [Oscillospiraceae bacterium]|nr:MFS transporter [Oscillospiraceae bacterium]
MTHLTHIPHIFRRVKRAVTGLPQGYVRFSSIEFMFWAAMASGSFTTVFLQAQGFTALQIGSMNAAFMTINIVAPPLWGVLSDKLRSGRKVFAVCMMVSSAFWVLLPNAVRWVSPLIVLLVLPLNRLFGAPTNALLDSWIIQRVNSSENRLSYGPIRLWGSIGFAIVAITYGELLKSSPIDIVFYGFGIAAIPCALLALRTDDSGGAAKTAMKLRDMQVSRILKTAPLTAFLLFIMFLYMPVNASFTFLPFLLQSVGERSAFVGTIVGVRALLEIPLLFFSARLLKRFKLTNLIITCACVYSLEMSLYMFCRNSVQILVVQCIHGLAFGLYLGCQAQHIFKLAPKGLAATAQTLAGCATAFAGIIGNLLGGAIVNAFNVQMFYMFSAIIMMLAVIMYSLWLRANRSKINAEAQ